MNHVLHKTHSNSRAIRAFVLCWVCVGLVACGSTGSSQQKKRRTPGAQAMTRYAGGIIELMAGNYTEAIMEFQRVVRSPGYVKYAALARLRIGDALFLQEKFDAAIETYRSFLKQFEGNPNVGYAQFRVGHAYFEQIPTGWFLTPPAEERQQTFVRNATAELRRFVSYYPTHRLVPQAQEMLDQCEQLLFKHEYYVADFYQRREKPAGVVLRLERAFRRYPEVAGANQEAYVMLAKAYAQTQRFAEATQMYQAYLDRFPDGSFRNQASDSLDILRTTQESE